MPTITAKYRDPQEAVHDVEVVAKSNGFLVLRTRMGDLLLVDQHVADGNGVYRITDYKITPTQEPEYQI